jgi:uncharacterized membrane protein YqaE (UPF0057 family)
MTIWINLIMIILAYITNLILSEYHPPHTD